jgi:hypothetical protein
MDDKHYKAWSALHSEKGMKAAGIPLDKCIPGHLYLIAARNADFGIFESQWEGFIIRRVKFDTVFLFEEYHWDYPVFATVVPLVDLGPAIPLPPKWSDIRDEQPFLQWLEEQEKKYNATEMMYDIAVRTKLLKE